MNNGAGYFFIVTDRFLQIFKLKEFFYEILYYY